MFLDSLGVFAFYVFETTVDRTKSAAASNAYFPVNCARSETHILFATTSIISPRLYPNRNPGNGFLVDSKLILENTIEILVFRLMTDRQDFKAVIFEQTPYRFARIVVDMQWGHEAIWFAAGFPGCLGDEKLEGIQIIRRGKQFSVHYEAFRYYRQHWRGYFDIVIDEINTIPFFTPLYVREKKAAYINQLAREVWFYESPFPLNLLGYLLEPAYLSFYRRMPIITISESTQKDLNQLGVRKVNVVHPGVGVTPLPQVPQPYEKAHKPTVLYVGRVVPSKRVADTGRELILRRILNSQYKVVLFVLV